MADIKIAGVMRAGAFSPNHIGNDAAIFNAVAEQLRRRGCEVHVYSEEQFRTGDITEPYIVSMCRENESIEKLQHLEQEDGRLVINSGFGIQNSTRERMTRILTGNGIPYPDSLIVATNENVRDALKKVGISACWVKRGDSHSQHKEDICYCRNIDEAQEVLQEYFYRGIATAVISRHLEGNIIKFYGIGGTNYFHWFYPYHNSQPIHGGAGDKGGAELPGFNPERLHEVCNECSRLLDVMIYGGDCVVNPEGEISIIEFNDWPSFAPCRQEAAPHIAKAVLARIKQSIKAKQPRVRKQRPER